MADYGGQNMEVKLWTKIMLANYGGLLWRTIYRGQLLKLNYGRQNDGNFLWRTIMEDNLMMANDGGQLWKVNYGRQNDGNFYVR